MLASLWLRLLPAGVFVAILVSALSLSMAAGDAILFASFATLSLFLFPKIARARTALSLRLEPPKNIKRKIPRRLRT